MLNPDQHPCPRCKGHGFHPVYDVQDEISMCECHICDGDGYVDWAYLPLIGDWESDDIQLDKEIAEEKEEEDFQCEYYNELDEQESGSFNINE